METTKHTSQMISYSIKSTPSSPVAEDTMRCVSVASEACSKQLTRSGEQHLLVSCFATVG